MAAIHYFAPARRSPSVFASAVAALANCVRMVSRALKNRRDATMLAGMDDRMLADIGLTRSDLRDAYAAAAAAAGADGSGGITGIAPVGEAFMRAIAMGYATPDMYAPDALSDGLLDLWFDDGTHASKYGSYLSALTLFGTLTGIDPLSLGADEIAARDLGISPQQAVWLQTVASLQLGFEPAVVPEPAVPALLLAGLGGVAAARRRRRAGSR